MDRYQRSTNINVVGGAQILMSASFEWAAHLVDRLSDAEGLTRSIDLAGVTADGLVLGGAPGPQGI